MVGLELQQRFVRRSDGDVEAFAKLVNREQTLALFIVA